MIINRRQTTTREMRALTIVGQADQIKRINAVTYKVKSQSSDLWYDVIHEYKQGWTCSCSDFLFRHVKVGDCKHIQAVYISKELRHKVLANNDVKEIESDNKLVCKCGSLSVIKIGIRHNKSGEMQVFKCKQCNKKWSDNLGFAKNRIDSKVITVALDLYFKGVSLRKVKEHVKLFYGISVSHVAILKWIHKFGEVVTPFVDSLVPKEMSGVYHVDEMMVHVRKEHHEKGHYQWLWNMMDNTTRFWISSKVSQRRELEDARAGISGCKKKDTSTNSRHT